MSNKDEEPLPKIDIWKSTKDTKVIDWERGCNALIADIINVYPNFKKDEFIKSITISKPDVRR